MNETNKDPTKDTAIIKLSNINILFTLIKSLIRMIPYPPNFKSTPAKIIDPATGASTWALGSHKCTEYIGILTKKAKKRKKVKGVPNVGLVNPK